MKKYFLAAAIAVLALAGPSMGSANAQTWFNRGGPTFIDRLVGNNGYYNGYANTGAYGYNPYGNYNYGNAYGGGMCNRMGNYGNYNLGNYGNYGSNGWNNGWHHHHHHHHW
jgi:hypothetical protein